MSRDLALDISVQHCICYKHSLTVRMAVEQERVLFRKYVSQHAQHSFPQLHCATTKDTGVPGGAGGGWMRAEPIEQASINQPEAIHYP